MTSWSVSVQVGWRKYGTVLAWRLAGKLQITKRERPVPSHLSCLELATVALRNVIRREAANPVGSSGLTDPTNPHQDGHGDKPSLVREPAGCKRRLRNTEVASKIAWMEADLFSAPSESCTLLH